jgi:hypothetical protein
MLASSAQLFHFRLHRFVRIIVFVSSHHALFHGAFKFTKNPIWRCGLLPAPGAACSQQYSKRREQPLSFRHSRLGKGRHFIVQGAGLAQQRDRNRGTTALTQTHAEVEQGFSTQCPQQACMTGFRRSVRVE